MRFSLTVALAAASLSIFGQTSGTFQPSSGAAVSWSIDSNHNLIWGGEPYIPEGLRIGGSAEEIAAARKAGFQDVIVDLPPTGSDWKQTMGDLDAAGMRYIVSIDGLLPPAKGFAIEPEAYRVDGINSDRHVDFNLPGASSALVVLVTKRDAAIQSSTRVPVVDGKFSYDIKTQTDLDEILLVYPEQIEASHADYWEGFDTRRDMILSSFEESKPGRGLRGILNPLGKLFESRFGNSLFVPESPFFRDELVSYMQTKYRNVQTAERSWDMSTNDISTFDGLARLVPLWSGTRGVPQLWDPDTNVLYGCDSRHSMAWTDIQTVVTAAAAKRFERLVPAVQSVADIPVLQEWSGWEPPFEAGKPELSGIGFEASGGDTKSVVDEASRPTSSILRWKNPGWLVCTHLSIDKDPSGAADLRDLLDQMESIGVRGWFFKDPSSAVVAAAASDAPRRASDHIAATTQVLPLFFPDNAFNPATPRRLPGGKWWLPSPEDGNRIDFGTGYFGYQYTDGSTYTTVIWSDTPRKTKLDMVNPKQASFARVDGTDPKPKLSRSNAEVDIDSTPLMITTSGEVPVPDVCLLETGTRFAQLLSYGNTLHLDTGVDGLFFQDMLQMYKVNPGGAFQQLRAHYWDLNRRLGKFSWVEAESTHDTNFSQILAQSGCSNGNVLVLRTPLTTDPSGFHATYDVPVHSSLDQEVWIAGHIPEEDLKYVSVEVAGQNLGITEGPISTYSSDYGWYKLGTTKITGNSTTLRLDVNSPGGAYLAVDVILLFPGNYKPNGVSMPDAVIFATKPVGKGRKH